MGSSGYPLKGRIREDGEDERAKRAKRRLTRINLSNGRIKEPEEILSVSWSQQLMRQSRSGEGEVKNYRWRENGDQRNEFG